MDAELPPVPGLWQAAVTHMVFEIEAVIVDPVREVELERHPDEPALEQRAHMQPPLDMRQDVFEAHNAARRRGLIEDRYRRNVRQVVVRLHVEKLRVLGA